MSTVYLAKDKDLGSYWAVKRITNSTKECNESFKKEVELLATLNHPDIPRIVDQIEWNHEYFVIMDFIDGIPLGKKVEQEGKQSEEEVIEWAKMLCDILHYLHTAKRYPVIYRDLKPDNIMLTQGGRVKLIDFGIAKECRPGQKQIGGNIGTKGYAAPEQYKDASNILDERTDIYSLGATLYYLLTGYLPGKPPDAIVPIRQVNPIISEGMEYIILKSTKDIPTCRYQNSQELKQDLIQINQLTIAYRKKMIRKLLLFASSCLCCFICIVISLIGYNGMLKEKEDNYLNYYKLAIRAESDGELIRVSEFYEKAISYKPHKLETYLLYFNALLPKKNENDSVQKIKYAIDSIRNAYLENKESAMYHNQDLLYQISKKCLEVNDGTYASYALEYIQILSEKNYPSNDLTSYQVIALNCSKNIATQDFKLFHEELLNLEEIADNPSIDASDRLEYYYIILLMYHTYPSNLENSYQKICQIGTKAKKILDHYLESEDFVFYNIVPMYEMVASAIYHYALTENNSELKEELYHLSLQWFSYLEDLNDRFSEVLWIKKANAYYAIYQINRDRISSRNSLPLVTTYLDRAIHEYLTIIETYQSSFLAYIYLTQATLDLELSKNLSQQNFSTVNMYYSKVMQLKEINKNLSNIDLSKFTSLKKAMQNAGLEVNK